MGVSNATALVHGGPLVEVAFSPHPDEIPLLAVEGVKWEHAIHKMMVDTGAELTVVEESVPQFLGIEPIRSQWITGIGGDVECPVYRLGIIIGFKDRMGKRSGATLSADIVAVPTPPDVNRPHVGLLGRDFLQFVRFEYDGPAGEYTIIREEPNQPPGRAATDHSERRERRRREKEARRKNRRK